MSHAGVMCRMGCVHKVARGKWKPGTRYLGRAQGSEWTILSSTRPGATTSLLRRQAEAFSFFRVNVKSLSWEM